MSLLLQLMLTDISRRGKNTNVDWAMINRTWVQSTHFHLRTQSDSL